MSDGRSVYPRIETGYAFTPDMIDDLVNKNFKQTFLQRIATLRIEFYIPKNLIVQHIHNKEKEKKTEKNRKRNGYIVDVLISVDIQEIAKLEEK